MELNKPVTWKDWKLRNWKDILDKSEQKSEIVILTDETEVRGKTIKQDGG